MRSIVRFLRRLPVFLVAAGITLFSGIAARGDEGMWLFSNPPKKILKERYGFDPDASCTNTSEVERPLQLGRIGLVHLVPRTRDHEPSHRRRLAAKALHQGQELSG